jgi:hypothetical protein
MLKNIALVAAGGLLGFGLVALAHRLTIGRKVLGF